ncbi:DUF1853 family protein [Agarivorans sp. MS3-6]|uniref:DUF1853 family protein n=1 Tax=Agarivorans sp. TSD2052 TaxID=2937286 RepID=UPI00200D4A03|nr:DUF1853 family protein [Agarivorans sp. TSD2052]UPW16808.1 DUF1853 family protein [Agarivorans sp. TSD2052]
MPRDSFLGDLEWCLHAPTLLSHSLPFAVDQHWKKQWQTALTQHLNTATSAEPNSRLGLYFEQLWRSLIALHPDWHMLADNVAIQQNGKTLGAIDFLVINHRLQQIEHWELAVKFYLAKNDCPQASDYVGPNQHDQLSNKLSKLILKQIPLGRHPNIQALCNRYPNYHFKQRILLSGYLFALGRPEHVEPQHLHWYSQSQWQAMHQSNWYALSKQQWLNPQGYSLNKWQNNIPLTRGPIQLYLPKQNQQAPRRIFICPDDWLIRANAVE